jgi:Domain of unknown function (DUF4397)
MEDNPDRAAAAPDRAMITLRPSVNCQAARCGLAAPERQWSPAYLCKIKSMRSFPRVFLQVCGLFCLFALASCGGSSNSTSPSNLRLVNSSKVATVTVALNGTVAFTNAAPTSATAYSGFSSGSYTVTATSSTGTVSSSTQTFGLGSGLNYSLLAYDNEGSLKLALVNENLVVPLAGFGTLSVNNVSADPGMLDVYVTAPGTTSLTGLSPTFSNVAGATSLATLVAGTYDIFVAAVGNRADVRFVLPSFVIASTQIQALALTSTSGGALVDGVAITSNGGVLFAPTASARVRLVSALPAASNLAITGTVGATALPTVFSPIPSAYTLVTGGASIYTISIAGAAVATLPPATFATGGDFTVLVYGTAAAPLVAVFADDNHQPAAGQANVRLVNGAVNSPSGVSLLDNSVAVANSVALGTASPYVGMTASATSVLQLIQSGVAPVTDTVALVPNAVYTVFILDTTLTPFIIKDR